MMIESNIIHAAHQNDVNKLLFLGSSCIYPKLAKQPMAESELLQGTLEPTNEPYAIAKIAGSNCVNLTTASTDGITAQSCRPTCTGHTTTSIQVIRM